MLYSVLGLAFLLIVLGSFGLSAAAFDRLGSPEKRLGRLVRCLFTEAVGVSLVAIAANIGARMTFALTAFIVALGLGGTAGLIHSAIINRRSEWLAKVEPKPEEP